MEPRRVLVTGGASGIGADVVRNFCSVGDDVTILDRVRSTDPDVRSVIGDVTAFADQQRAVAEAAPQGRLDVLVANAGIHDGGRRLGSGDSAEMIRGFTRLLEVNVVGYVQSIEASVAALRRANGCVVLTLSDASFDVQGNGSGAAYVAAKHAGLGLLRAAARDLAPDVRVNAVAPGGVATALSVERGGQTTPVIDDPDALADRLAHRTLLGRGARLDEISAAYLFLASAEAAAITGQVLRVDGGLSA